MPTSRRVLVFPIIIFIDLFIWRVVSVDGTNDCAAAAETAELLDGGYIMPRRYWRLGRLHAPSTLLRPCAGHWTTTRRLRTPSDRHRHAAGARRLERGRNEAVVLVQRGQATGLQNDDGGLAVFLTGRCLPIAW